VEPVIYNATKKDLNEKYSKLCTVDTKNYASYDIYIMSGEAIKPYEYYANEIVRFIEKWYKLLLKTIVIDFIKDERGIIYFLNLKAFTPIRESTDVNPNFNNTLYLKDEKNLNRIYKTHTCRLCMLSYPKSKITKTVTLKLLMNLKESLKKRNEKLLDHINGTNFSNSIGCRLCDLCYKLLITEQELEEIQKTIALCSNIPLPSEEDITKKKKNDNSIKIPQRIKNLNQWRVLFYFIRIQGLEIEKLPFNKDTNYKLCIKLMDQKFSIPIFNEVKKFINMQEIMLNFVKIFYFFTNENSNLKQLLKNEDVDFRILINDDWNSPLAQCNTNSLSFFDPELKTIRVKNTLNFFSQKDNINYFSCQLYIGITNDGMVHSENLNMYSYKMTKTIFLTEPGYYSPHALPNDWYELFIGPETTYEEEEEQEKQIEDMINEIIKNLDFNMAEKDDKNLDELYDPYEQLVQIQNRNNIIKKIKSVPLVVDKNTIEKNKESSFF
jgi:hypothetical protein